MADMWAGPGGQPAAVAGLSAPVGRAGIGLGALLVFLVGNPLSAVGAGQAIAVLVGYAVIGVGLTLVGRRAPADAPRTLSAPAGRAAVPATVTG
jgi:hypothetical protein